METAGLQREIGKKSTDTARLCADDVMSRVRLKEYQNTYAEQKQQAEQELTSVKADINKEKLKSVHLCNGSAQVDTTFAKN